VDINEESVIARNLFLRGDSSYQTTSHWASGRDAWDAAVKWMLERRKPKPETGWTPDEWKSSGRPKTSKTEMMGSVERAVEEVERRYDGLDMPYELAKLYDTAREACEDYTANRRKPTKAQLWSIYYDLVKFMERVEL
jgi:hypothetical protein